MREFISKILLLSAIFILPFHIKLPLYEASFSLNLTDFTRFFFYPHIFLICGAFLCMRKKNIKISKKSVWISGLMFLSLFPSFFLSQDLFFSFLVLTFYITAFLLYILIKNQNFPTSLLIQKILLLSALFQSILGIIQYIKQGSLGLWFLGESVFSAGMTNIATFQYSGETFIRSYGTFPHPNILGGFLSITLILFFLFPIFQQIKKSSQWIIIILLTCGICVTFSRSAILMLLIGLIFLFVFHFKKKYILSQITGIMCLLTLFSFFIPTFSYRIQNTETENNQRIEQYENFSSLLENNIFGKGLGYRYEISEIVPYWQFQPFHNTFAQISFELGILSTLLFIILYIYWIYRTWKKNKVLIILPFLLLIPLLTDHYLFTSFQGILLFAISIAFTTGKQQIS